MPLPKVINHTLIVYTLINSCTAQEQSVDSLNKLLEFHIEAHAIEPEISLPPQTLPAPGNSKLALNSANREMLLNLRILSNKQITTLLKHRKRFGELLHFEELQTLSGFDSETIAKLRLSTKIANTPSVKKSTQHDLMLRYKQVLEQAVGYKKEYLGSPAKLMVRFRGNRGLLRYGLNAEKDPGEPFFRKTNRQGFDFYTGFLQWQSASTRSTIIAGDYSAGVGQHLTFSNGMHLRKSAYVLSILPSKRQLLPSASSNEVSFLRGLAIHHRLGKKWKLLILVSNKAIDARLKKTGDEHPYIVSIPITGFHRTQKEISAKRKARETITSIALTYEWKQLEIGAITFDRQVQPKGLSSPLTWIKSLQKQLPKTGIFMRGKYRNVLFFGEISRDTNNAIAHLTGVVLAPDKRIAMGWLNRRYPTQFDGTFSRSFSQKSTIGNESGNYFALLLSPDNPLRISLSTDFYHYPSPSFRADFPVHGTQHLGEITYTVRKKWQCLIRYQVAKTKQNSEVNSQKTNEATTLTTRKTRLEVMWHLNKSLRYRVRLVKKTHLTQKQGLEKGHLAFQDVSLKPPGKMWAFTWRYAIFDTPSYNTRIYAYEHDVLYAFSIPAYHGRGNRFYFIWRQKWTSFLTSWFRYSVTFYSDRSTIGSGLDEIPGSTKSAITLQLRLNF